MTVGRAASANSKCSLDVLMVIGSLNVGGAERHVAQIARELVRRGWTVGIYCLSEPGDVGVRLREQGVEVETHLLGNAQPTARAIVGRALRLGSSVASLCLYMLRRRPRIVHFFLPAAYVVGGICAWVTNRPIRVMSRRSLSNYQRRQPAIARLERPLHRQMAAVVANAKAVLSQLRSEENIPVDRSGLIYNGIDPSAMEPSRSREETRRLLGIPDEALVFLIVANLIPYKGHRDLLEGMAGIAGDLPSPWRLVCVGRDNGIGGELETYSESLGIGDNVIWLGLRDDVPTLVHAADIGISSSHEEGFSNAVLECMAGGLAMVATDVGGNAEAVAHNRNGLVVSPHDPAALGAAILDLGRDVERRARFGAAGRRRATDEFSLSHCVEQYEKLYRGLEAGKTVGEALSQDHAG